MFGLFTQTTCSSMPNPVVPTGSDGVGSTRNGKSNIGDAGRGSLDSLYSLEEQAGDTDGVPLPIPHSVGEGGGDGQPAIPIEVVMVDCGTATEAARRRQTHGIRRQTHEDGNTDDTSQTPTLSDGDTDGVPLSASHSVGEGGGEGQPAIPVEVVMTYCTRTLRRWRTPV